MEVVAGIGGLFFRAQDPQALARGYQQHFGFATFRTRQRGPAVAAGGRAYGLCAVPRDPSSL